MVAVAELDELSEDELDDFAAHMHAGMTFAHQALAAEAPSHPAWYWQRAARERRRLEEAEAERDHHERYLKKWRTRDGRGLRFTGLLFDDQADVVEAMWERLAEEMGPDAETGSYEPYPARLADALHELADSQMRADALCGRPTVILTVDLDRLLGQPGVARGYGGQAVSTESALRLA